MSFLGRYFPNGIKIWNQLTGNHITPAQAPVLKSETSAKDTQNQPIDANINIPFINQIDAIKTDYPKIKSNVDCGPAS